MADTINNEPAVNEMDIPLAIGTPTPPMSPSIDYVRDNGYAGSAVAVMSPAGMGDDISVAIGDAEETNPMMDPSKITIYAGNITPISYADTDPIACFDVVFTVGMQSDGASKTYQVVKRIGIDKCKLALQASSGSPVSVVEAVQPPKQEKKPVISEIKKFRRLAGLE